eukprot:TRINITY_DN25765_c0_g2_i1.p1 TRINITY_DN25765_c0_g2~~TRINITY_DN25765_c0_g2_i1.p1  ORF type:complete len:432 (-),score=81.83 TRINITY_DN25765_c0_g2_i1:317-1612(-)
MAHFRSDVLRLIFLLGTALVSCRAEADGNLRKAGCAVDPVTGAVHPTPPSFLAPGRSEESRGMGEERSGAMGGSLNQHAVAIVAYKIAELLSMWALRSQLQPDSRSPTATPQPTPEARQDLPPQYQQLTTSGGLLVPVVVSAVVGILSAVFAVGLLFRCRRRLQRRLSASQLGQLKAEQDSKGHLFSMKAAGSDTCLTDFGTPGCSGSEQESPFTTPALSSNSSMSREDEVGAASALAALLENRRNAAWEDTQKAVRIAELELSQRAQMEETLKYAGRVAELEAELEAKKSVTPPRGPSPSLARALYPGTGVLQQRAPATGAMPSASLSPRLLQVPARINCARSPSVSRQSIAAEPSPVSPRRPAARAFCRESSSGVLSPRSRSGARSSLVVAAGGGGRRGAPSTMSSTSCGSLQGGGVVAFLRQASQASD